MTAKYECGALCFHPQCLQRCGTIGFFVLWFSLTCAASQSVHTYLVTQVTTLERQFGFNSAQSGVIIACNDIGFLVFAVLMGYLAPKVHIPKFIGVCTAVVAIAAILCATPYFVSKDYLHGEAQAKLVSLPNLEMIKMMKEMQQMMYESSLAEKKNGGSLSSTLPPYTHAASNNSVPGIMTNTTGDNSTVSPFTGLRPTSSTVKPSATSPAYNPFKPMLDKLRGFLGDEDFNAALQKAGIQNGVPSGMTDMKRLAKVLASTPEYFDKLPPTFQQRALMFSRLSKRSVPEEPPEAEITDIVKLSPFHLMTIMTPTCTLWPKGAQNCEMFAKFLNKGFTNKYTGLAFGLLAFGMVIQGICKAPRMPMGILYFDDNGTKGKTPKFLAYTMTAFSFGVVLSFGVGIGCSRLYVTLEDVDIHPMNFHWIGAWWLGYVLLAVINVVFALPLLCFPKRLRPKPRKAAYQQSNGNEVGQNGAHGIREFWSATKRCFTNPILVGLWLSGTLTFMLVSGSMPFAPKYLETQFSLPIWLANAFVGGVWLVPVLIFLPLLGLFISRRKMQSYTILKLNVLLRVVLVILSALGMIFGCDTVKVIGYNAEITSNDVEGVNSTDCISTCNCETVDYFPVCGSNGRNYFSACHAGCRNNEDMTFVDCACVGSNGTATMGLCKDDCKMLIPYLIVTALLSVTLTGTGLTQALVAFRSVPDKDRAFSIGLFMFIANLLGWMPGPIIVGKLVDSVCMLWRTMCAEVIGGACAVYDTTRFRYAMHGYFLTITGLTVIIGIFLLYKSRNKTDWNDNPLFQTQADDIQENGGEMGEKLMA